MHCFERETLIHSWH